MVAAPTAPLAPITEEKIEALVNAFYGQVHDDPLLGPVFAERLHGDWTAHLATMCRFWSTLMLATGRYKGLPVAVHLTIASLSPAHFARWLELWRITARELAPQAAEMLIWKAEKMAVRLQAAIAETK